MAAAERLPGIPSGVLKEGTLVEHGFIISGEAAASAEQQLQHHIRFLSNPRTMVAIYDWTNEMPGHWKEAAPFHNHCHDKEHVRRGSCTTNYVSGKLPDKLR